MYMKKTELTALLMSVPVYLGMTPSEMYQGTNVSGNLRPPCSA